MAGEDNTRGVGASVWRSFEDTGDWIGLTNRAGARASYNLQNTLKQMSDAYKQYRQFYAGASENRLSNQLAQTRPMQQYLHRMLPSLEQNDNSEALLRFQQMTNGVTGGQGPVVAAQPQPAAAAPAQPAAPSMPIETQGAYTGPVTQGGPYPVTSAPTGQGAAWQGRAAPLPNPHYQQPVRR